MVHEASELGSVQQQHQLKELLQKKLTQSSAIPYTRSGAHTHTWNAICIKLFGAIYKYVQVLIRMYVQSLRLTFGSGARPSAPTLERNVRLRPQT